MSKEKEEYEKRKKFFIHYILDNIYVKYYDMPFAHYEERRIPSIYHHDYNDPNYKKYKKEDSKTLSGEMAVYLIDILVAVRALPDVMGTSSCGQYILLHYYYKKEEGKVRFLIGEEASYIVFFDKQDNEYEPPCLIEPNTIKEIAWEIDDHTVLWDGVPPSDD